MKETALFFKRFLRQKGKVGALVPSSGFLAAKMARMVPFGTSRAIVELGGGTGAVTAALLKQRKKETSLVIFEPDEHFFPHLVEKFAREKKVTVLKEKAEDIGGILKAHRLPRPDCIVSSLPFAAFGRKGSARIFEEIQKLLPHKGVFILYQYTPLMLPLISRYFVIKRVALVPLNVPPALVLRCVSRLKREK